ISEMIGMRARNLGQNGKVVSVSLRDEKFYSYSHQKKLNMPTYSTNTIYEASKELFDEMWDGTPIRRFNISLSELSSSEFCQLSLLEGYNERDEKLNKTIDKIRYRYGYNSIFRSSFLHSGIKPIIGGVMEEEYPMMSS